MNYIDIPIYESILTPFRLIKVKLSEFSIEPIKKCSQGYCQTDSSICGFFEGLIDNLSDEGEDGGFLAKCSKEVT